MVAWHHGYIRVYFCTFLGHHPDFMTDYAKKTGSLGVCIVCDHEFGSVSPCTVNRKLSLLNFSLAYFSANTRIL